MANLINANSNQNYFQFHKSHYKYEQGEPLGLPVYRSIGYSRNFYRIWKVPYFLAHKTHFFPRKM